MSTKQKIYIPTYISSVDYAPARVQPRILFYNGPKACETYYIRSGSTATTFDSFPYFDNYSGENTTTESLSLLFNNEVAPYGELPTSSLYTEYWENYINLLYNPRTRLVNASAIIPLADYFKMELNSIAQFRGNYYHIRAINDYNLTTGECNIQLLGPVLEGSLNFDIDFDCGFNYTSSIVTTTTAPPTTTTSTTVDPTSILQWLVVGGGGAGGSDGGGGAGGFISGSSTIQNNYAYQISVGSGGIANTVSASGQNSSFDGVVSYGGGAGGSQNGKDGGSGGGAGGNFPNRDNYVGGLGVSPQGNNGGSGKSDLGSRGAGGGGGGAQSIGQNAYYIGVPDTSYPGNGGDGKAWLNGNYYAGGGGGTNELVSSFIIANGGIGGGGNGNTTGSANTGGGGGGNSKNGGSGVVIARYLGLQQANGGIITQSDGYTYHTFTASGELTFGNPTTTTTTTISPLAYYNVQSNFDENPVANQTAFTYVDFNDVLRSVVIDVPPITNSYNFIAKANTVSTNAIAGVSNTVTNITNSTTYTVPPTFRNYNIKSTGTGLTKITYQSSDGNTIQFTSSDPFDFNVCAVENSIVQSYNVRATITLIPGGC